MYQINKYLQEYYNIVMTNNIKEKNVESIKLNEGKLYIEFKKENNE